jgi:hypothetical protein
LDKHHPDLTAENVHKKMARQHALLNKIAKQIADIGDTFQRLKSGQDELCAVLCDAVIEHGEAVGVSAPVVALVTAPKKPEQTQ